MRHASTSRSSARTGTWCTSSTRRTTPRENRLRSSMQRLAHTLRLQPSKAAEARMPQQWASWDVETLTLTLSRPPELDHAQLEAIWSPYINNGLNEETI